MGFAWHVLNPPEVLKVERISEGRGAVGQALAILNDNTNVDMGRPRRPQLKGSSSMKAKKILVAVVFAIAIGAPVAGIWGSVMSQADTPSGFLSSFLHGGQTSAPMELAALERTDAWFNSPPLKAQDLRGKVVLVDFWTYTCVNWLRTLPYVRAWAEKYKDKGLVVVGVHSPEFAFEKNLDNIRRAVKDLGVDYPVAVDSEHVIWRAFHNSYWPALYFIDAQGRVRHMHFGEGAYEQSEMTIQRLLMEAGASGIGDDTVSVTPRGLEVAADWATLKSPESYTGYAQAQGFASPGGVARDKSRIYAFPAQLRLNEWALSGDWTVKDSPAVLNKANGAVVYRFHARDANLVMGPATAGTAVQFRVRIDGKPPEAAHGTDIDAQGEGTVAEQRTYQLLRQPGPIADRQVEIEFLGPGVEIYCFTFG